MFLSSGEFRGGGGGGGGGGGVKKRGFLGKGAININWLLKGWFLPTEGLKQILDDLFS